MAHRGHADPLPRPPQPRPDRAIAASPVLVTPSRTGTSAVQLSGVNPFGALSPFPATSPPHPSATLDQRWTGGVGAWETYIDEASRRFGVPPSWVRLVMGAESAGLQYIDGRPITSSKGAMGLMQVMPGTYAALRTRYGLGPDPYDPHDNVLAGTAYIREMYDRFGAPGFLAAYNAGPGRVSDLLTFGRALPEETKRYNTAVTPSLIGNTDRGGVGTQVASPSTVQDLTALRILTDARSAPIPAPRSPEEAPLFVTAARTGAAPPLQVDAPPNDGLFVVLHAADRRREDAAPDTPEN